MENNNLQTLKINTMKISITKKQQIRNKIDLLILSNKFITWDMLGVDPYTHNDKYLSYEAKIVFEYMKELKLNYVRYIEKFSNGIMHGNAKGFYNDINGRRKSKIQQIEKLNS